MQNVEQDILQRLSLEKPVPPKMGTDSLCDPNSKEKWREIFKETFLLLKSKRFLLSRKTFFPIFAKEEERQEPLFATKLGGNPCMLYGDMWPICGDCGVNLKFIFQIDLNNSPHTGAIENSDRIMQFFVCPDFDFENHHGRGFKVRLIESKEMKAKYETNYKFPLPPFVKFREVEKWEEKEVYCEDSASLDSLVSNNSLYCHRIVPLHRIQFEENKLLFNFKNLEGFESCEEISSDNKPEIQWGGFPNFSNFGSVSRCEVCKKAISSLVLSVLE